MLCFSWKVYLWFLAKNKISISSRSQPINFTLRFVPFVDESFLFFFFFFLLHLDESDGILEKKRERERANVRCEDCVTCLNLLPPIDSRYSDLCFHFKLRSALETCSITLVSPLNLRILNRIRFFSFCLKSDSRSVKFEEINYFNSVSKLLELW